MNQSAMCCDCGNVRQTSTWQGLAEVPDDWDIFDPYGHDRCLVWRKCAVCDEVTSHAYLRSDGDQDELEQVIVGVDVVRSADNIVAELQVELALDWLTVRGVTVVWDKVIAVAGVGAVLRHWLGDGACELVLPSDQEAGTLTLVLEQVMPLVERPGASAGWCVLPAIWHADPVAFRFFEMPKEGGRW
uniref:Uncharacterized protein n=1 Tax=Streptoalloteichus sp. ATCC 53650 TaxID=756733 RepID=K4P0U9_9PSEU|nr:hypothetical protein [Streptoalloteichus sp. ATCC 53650]